MAEKMTKQHALEVSQDPDRFTIEECSAAAARLRATVKAGNAGYNEIQYLRHQADAAQAATDRRVAGTAS